MPPYRQMGSVPRKRHIAHRHEPGYHGEGIYYEEVVTTAGFGRAYSIVYHLRPPTRVRQIEAAGDDGRCRRCRSRRLRHHHLKTGQMHAPAIRSRPRAAAAQRRRDPVAAAGPRSRRPSCIATPPPTR